MKSSAKDVFATLYEAFHKLDTIKPPDEPDLTASRVEIEVYEERLAKAHADVAKILEDGAKLLDRYVDGRIRKIIEKKIYDGDLMAK